MIIATTYKCLVEINWLLNHGASTEAVCSGGDTALVHAVVHGHGAATALLLDRSADPNARDRDGWTALMVVAFLNAAEFARDLIAMLIAHGADLAAIVPGVRSRTIPEICMAYDKAPHRVDDLDTALATPPHAPARRRLLDQLTADQGTAWLPRSCAAEAAVLAAKPWSRKP